MYFRFKFYLDTPSFQRWDWLKNERENEVEISIVFIQCSMSTTKYDKCESDELYDQ